MEEWRDIPSYPTLEASSLGRVRPKPKIGKMPRGRGVRRYFSDGTFGAITRASKNAIHRYRGAYYRGIGNVKVHRAVCEAFNGPAPFPKAVVIHLDEDGLNNRPENLKWGTQKENLNMPKIKAYHRSRTGENNPYVRSRS